MGIFRRDIAFPMGLDLPMLPISILAAERRRASGLPAIQGRTGHMSFFNDTVAAKDDGSGDFCRRR
jgi:hypothetical protein